MQALQKIILATNNQGKIRELSQLLDGVFEVVSMAEMQVEEVPEDGLTFIENALIKAKNAASQAQLPAIADDSGIVVRALGGKPGIYSARYALPDKGDEANLQKLLFEMTDVADGERQAHFTCALVFVESANDPNPIIIERHWQGEILRQKSGNDGFGYDPIFYLPDLAMTSAELSIEEKSKISHRGQAFRALLAELKSKMKC